jgi:hypothetical protein
MQAMTALHPVEFPSDNDKMENFHLIKRAVRHGGI